MVNVVATIQSLTLSTTGSNSVNIGNDGEYTIRELAEITARLAGTELRLTRDPLPPDDPTRRKPDVTLARELLDWQPTTPLETGLRRTLDYFRKGRAPL